MLRRALAQALQHPEASSEGDGSPDHLRAFTVRRRAVSVSKLNTVSTEASAGAKTPAVLHRTCAKPRLRALLQIDALLRPSPWAPFNAPRFGRKSNAMDDARRIVSAPEATPFVSGQRQKPRRRARSESRVLSLGSASEVQDHGDRLIGHWGREHNAAGNPALVALRDHSEEELLAQRRSRRQRSLAPSPCVASSKSLSSQSDDARERDTGCSDSTAVTFPRPTIVAWTHTEGSTSPQTKTDQQIDSSGSVRRSRERTSPRRRDAAVLVHGSTAPKALLDPGSPSPPPRRRIEAGVQTATTDEPPKPVAQSSRVLNTPRRQQSAAPPSVSRPSRARKPFNLAPLRTQGLKPLVRETKHGRVELVEVGGQDECGVSLDVRLWTKKAMVEGVEIGRTRQVVTVNADGVLQVFSVPVEATASPLRAVPGQLRSATLLASYHCLAALPSRLQSVHRYLERFVDLVRAQTPRFAFRPSLCSWTATARCFVMMNDKDGIPADIEVRWPTKSFTTVEQIRSVRVSPTRRLLIVTWWNKDDQRQIGRRHAIACDQAGGSGELETWLMQQRAEGAELVDAVRLAQRCVAMAEDMAKALNRCG